MVQKIRNGVLSIILVAAFVSATYATNGLNGNGFSARMIGRGATNIGFGLGGTILIDNPAALAWQRNRGFEANLALLFPVVYYQNALNPRLKGKNNVFPIPGVSYINGGDRNFIWGFGAYFVGGVGSDWQMNHDMFRVKNSGPQADPTDNTFVPQKYHSLLGYSLAGPAAALKLGNNFSVGAGAYLYYGTLEFNMPFSLPTAVLQGKINNGQGLPPLISPGKTFGDVFAAPSSQGGLGYQELTSYATLTGLAGTGFGFRLGLSFKPSDKVTLGLKFTSPVDLTLSGGKATMDINYQFNNALAQFVQNLVAQGLSQEQATAMVIQTFNGMGIDVNKVLQNGVASHFSAGTQITLPMEIGFGIGWYASDRARFGLDLQYTRWSSALDKMPIKLTGGTDPTVSLLVGSNNIDVDFPLDWNDSFIIRFGGEYDLSESFTVRAGYIYGNNPVPKETVFPLFPTIVENHVTVGASYALSENFWIHFAYEHAFNKTQTAARSPQYKLQSEFSGATNELAENILHFTVSYGLK